VRFCLLGPVEVRLDGRSLALGRARERLVLATLLVRAGRMVPADRLIALLWPETVDPPPTARQQLHNAVAGLRRRLQAHDADLIVTRPLGYELRLGTHELDLADFRRLSSHGQEAIASGDHAVAIDALSRALALWRGPALAGVPEELASALRQELEDEQVAAAEALARAQLAAGDHVPMLARLRELLSLHPYHESLHELHLRGMAAIGRRADALVAYQRLHADFVESLGVEPGKALTELHGQLLDGGEEVRPATPVIRPRPNQLPGLDVRLVGRDQLIKQITDVLRPTRDTGHDRPQLGPSIALITGGGGAGKSALAVVAGHILKHRYPDGVLYVHLRGTTANPVEPYEAAGQMLRSLGTDPTTLPADLDERVGLLRSVLAGTRTLVVLDDSYREHQIRPLLPSEPGCGVIVTSRRRLGALMGACRFEAGPLEPDDATALLLSMANREVAVSHCPEENRRYASRVAELCGYLPLALCVAGARIELSKHLDLPDLIGRMEAEHARLDQLSLGDSDVRASIAASYEDCLCVDGQRLFRRMGLFGGAVWPEWAADAVVDYPPALVRRILDELVDIHLLDQVEPDLSGQPRFRLHDLVAEFALERLRAEEPGAEPEIRGRVPGVRFE